MLQIIQASGIGNGCGGSSSSNIGIALVAAAFERCCGSDSRTQGLLFGDEVGDLAREVARAVDG